MKYLIPICTGKYTGVSKLVYTNILPFIGEHDKYHYCYEIYVPSTKKFYRGVRSCKNWITDNYLGSSRHIEIEDDILRSSKVFMEILSFHKSRTHADHAEMEYIPLEYVNRLDTYNISIPKNPLCSYGRSTMIDLSGRTFSMRCTDNNFNKYKGVNHGKTLVYDTSNNIILINSEKYISIHKNKVCAINSHGNKEYVSIYDTRLNTGELTYMHKNKVVVNDINGNTLQISIDVFNAHKDKYTHINKDKRVIRHIDGTIESIHIDDYDKTLHDGLTTGMTNAKLKGTNTIVYVSVSDDRWNSGELVGFFSNTWSWNKKLVINGICTNVKELSLKYGIKCTEVKSYILNNKIKYQLYEKKGRK